MNEEGSRRKCGNISVTSRESACSRADQEMNEEGRRRKCGDIFVTSRDCACSRADRATWVATARFTQGVKANAQPKSGIPIGGKVEIRPPPPPPRALH
jgi:hypothetical protein